MNRKYEQLRAKAFSAMQEMAAQDPDFEQARMLIGAADTEASLKKRTVRKSIDTEWITRVEEALPSLDQIIRNPKVFIEDEEEVVPVELTRRISEKSIKHLAQHTNLILKIEDDEITPSRILNVFHEESYLTYENKFTNTLLVRLAAFVDKRYQALVDGAGVEKDYEFEYGVDFEHYAENEKRSTAKVKLHIELNSPLEGAETTSDDDLNVQFASAIERIRKINQAITAYLSSPFVQKMGRNYIRPPVIRTNAILKNKHFKDCLTLWEFIEGYDKAGYSILGEEFAEMPSDEYVSDLYGLLALQYTQFYHGIVGDENKLLAERQMPEILPEFDRDMTEEELDDYLVYDSEYKKMVPVSRLMNNRKKLSEDEHRVREAIEVALRADEILNADLLAAEEEERRIERERLKAEEEARRRKAAMEEAAKRGPLEVRYKRSFLSRYIQSGEELQGYYTAIKNELLSYERVGARISWKCESFRRKKDTLARINVMGKSLYLYLALPFEDYAGKQGVSDASAKSADTPLLLKIKSERACKRAVALIAEMMQRLEVARIEREPEDYRMPYEDTEALIERGLVKRILPDGVVPNEFDELVTADVAARIGERKATADEEEAPITAEEPSPAEEPTAEEAVADEDAISVESAETVSENDGNEGSLLGFQAKYRRSFLSRYIQSDEELQERYTAIKNELLSYDRVGARTSWKCETFRRKKETLARINVMGKSLYLYLALPLEGHEGLQGVSDAGEKSADTPLLIKVKSERSCKRALALIAEMMQGIGAVKTARDPEDYRMPYEDTETLVERGLVKRIMTASAVIPKAEKPTDEVEEPILAVADEPSFDVDADDLILEESAATVSENGEINGGLLGFQAKYRRSFLSRYIQADEELQERYTAIKNELLSYKRVSARTSWKCETYKLSKQVLARINVMGKSLYLYLALPLEGHEGLQGVSDAGERSADTPLLLKVKSERSCKRALALIAEMMQGIGAVQTARDPEDYRMPFEDDETLFARGLLKQILRKNDFLAVTPEPVYEVAEEIPVLEETPVTVSENDAFAEEEAPAVSVETVPEKVDEEPAILSEEPLAEEVVLSPIVEAPLATWERVEREVVDLAQVDFNDVEFIHDVTDAMLEKLGTTVYAVAVERKRLVERTCLRLEFTKIPKEQRKKLRVHPKNFIFRDENKPIDVSIPFTKGVVIPYTKKEYAALAASAKKQVQAYAERVREYDLTRAQLTVMRVLTITNISLVDKLQKLENRLALQRSMLPTASRWRALIKE